MAGVHGGKRSGAGRKPVLTLHEGLSVGGECEHYWRAIALDQAKERRRNRNAAVRSAQARAEMTPLRLRKTRIGRKNIQDIKEDIDRF
jgi:hypothetical protein